MMECSRIEDKSESTGCERDERLLMSIIHGLKDPGLEKYGEATTTSAVPSLSDDLLVVASGEIQVSCLLASIRRILKRIVKRQHAYPPCDPSKIGSKPVIVSDMVPIPLRASSSVPSGLHKLWHTNDQSVQELLYANSSQPPDVAYLQALKAAELAFERANGRTNAVLSGQNSSPARSKALLSSEPTGIKRVESIRFAGPSAQKNRNQSIRRNQIAKSQEMVLSDNDDQNTSTFESFSENPEYIEENVASQPSSYRKLHKARSMFNPGAASFTQPSLGRSRVRGHSKRSSVHSSGSLDQASLLSGSRLRRSFSFLHGAPERLYVKTDDHSRNDAAVELARDRFLQDLHLQRIKEQSSLEQPRRTNRAQRVFRRTVRSSQNSSETTMPSAQADIAKMQALGQKARTASHAFKRIIRKMLGRAQSEESTLPVQHLSASRTHYGQAEGDTVSQRYQATPSPDIGLLRRVGSRETVQRSPSGSVQGDIASKSIRSVVSDDNLSNQRSRVTSWTTSTPANTVIMPQQPERKRLYVIREDGGPHEPSSSTQILSENGPSYSAFRQPANFDHADPAAARRIFSALQREIGNVGRVQAIEDHLSEAEMLHVRQATTPPSRLIPQQLLWSSDRDEKRTIKDYPGPIVHLDLPPKPSPMALDSETVIHVGTGSPSPNRQEGFHSDRRMTPQQIAQLNEDRLATGKRPLGESRSGFFPRDTRLVIQRPNPYRLATQECRSGNAGISDDVANSENDTFERIRVGSATLSESVYSRTSGGRSPEPGSSSSSIIKHPRPEGQASVHGSSQDPVTIDHLPNNSPASSRSSNSSSGRWRHWRAIDVARGHHGGVGEDGIYNALPIGKSGHRREYAQIDKEDVTIGKAYNSRVLSRQSTGISRHKQTSRFVAGGFKADLHPDTKHAEWPRPTIRNQKENRPAVIIDGAKGVFSSQDARKTAKPAVSVIPQSPGPSRGLLAPSGNEVSDSSSSVKGRSSPQRFERLQRLQHLTSRSQIGLRDFDHQRTADVEEEPTNSSLDLASNSLLTHNHSTFSTPAEEKSSSSGLLATEHSPGDALSVARDSRRGPAFL